MPWNSDKTGILDDYPTKYSWNSLYNSLTAREQAHHFYHMGLLHNQMVDQLYLHTSCNFPSTVRDDIDPSADRIHFCNFFEMWFMVMRLAGRKSNKIVIAGINTPTIAILLPALLLRAKLHLLFHGQIAGIKARHKWVFWRFFSSLVRCMVINPIYSGPDFINKMDNPSRFEYAKRKKARSDVCLIYGTNKTWLSIKDIPARLQNSGLQPEILTSLAKAIDSNLIVERARNAGFAFIQLDYNHYQLNPSGRIADLRFFDLIPVVLTEDFGTQQILAAYGINYKTV